MYYAICYVSTANNLSEDEVKSLLSNTAKKNLTNNISGILIHNSGNFLQYMEGTQAAIQAVFFNKIAQDKRHKGLIVIVDKKTKHLYFNGYETGFTSILKNNNTARLRSYIKLLKQLDSDEVTALTSTIESFLGKSSKSSSFD